MLGTALLGGGVLGQVIVWRLVARDRLPFWPATATTFVVLGVASLLVGDPRCCRETQLGTAVGVGGASGAVLYVATRVVVHVATRQPVLSRAVADVYRRSRETGFVTSLILTLVLAVPGEELFWRGFLLPELSDATTSTLGAALTWVVAIGVNAAWASAPLLAAAAVGGGLWTALATWTGGVGAPIASHLVWTGLMLLWPPRAGRDKVLG